MFRMTILISALTLWSCGAEDLIKDHQGGSGEVELEISVPGETLVKDLDDTQKTTINDELNGAIKEAVTAQDYCRQSALVSASTTPSDPSGTCESTLSQCELLKHPTPKDNVCYRSHRLVAMVSLGYPLCLIGAVVV